MPKVSFTAEQLLDPSQSEVTVVRTEDAEGCYGEICGQYHEDQGGNAVKPHVHSHMVVTGHNPETASHVWPISK